MDLFIVIIWKGLHPGTICRSYGAGGLHGFFCAAGFGLPNRRCDAKSRRFSRLSIVGEKNATISSESINCDFN